MRHLRCTQRNELAPAAGLICAIGLVLAAAGRFDLFPIALPIGVAAYLGLGASRRR
jgi:hypothetical protein